MAETVRGQLLIAAPQLSDYFRRTVVLVLEHSDDGAMGLVLNRPTEASVAMAVPQLADLAGDEELVHAGGPVQPDAVVALGDFEDPDEAASTVVGTIGVLDPELTDPDVRRLRVFAGYAGWAPGQLDSELDEGAWIVADAEPDDAFAEDDVWADVLHRKGGGYVLMTTMPDDPSLN